MKKFILSTLIVVFSDIAYAFPPGEPLVKSCLLGKSVDSSIAIRSLAADQIVQENNYGNGFDAPFTFRDRGVEVGYAESKTDQALIYSRKLYRLSRSRPLRNNRTIKPGPFNPTLAQWSIAKEGAQQYFCVSFNFDGLGRSGTFQNVHGGYLLNTKTRHLYFVVRDTRQ
jgi:hypothetical protein